MIINDWYEQRRLRLLAAAATGDRVLDVGYSHMPNPYFGSASVVGVDLEPPSGDVGYDETIVADVAELPVLFPGRQFDSVVAGELIEHLEDPYGFLRSLLPLIAPGGRLVVSTPNPFGFPVFLAEWARTRKAFYAEDHTFYFAPRWVDRMLEDSGFRVIEHQAVGLWVPRLRIPWSPIGLSYQVLYIAEPASG